MVPHLHRNVTWLVALASFVACHENPKPSGTSSAASSSAATTSTARPLSLAQPSSHQRSNPLGAYTDDVLGRYDAKASCLAVCSAALRCRHDNLFSAGSREVGTRLKAWRNVCAADFPRRAGYLDDARKCLKSADCEGFNACATAVLPRIAP